MGGHGGLNILPQKRWNVYNFENREVVRKDEEAAAEEERRIAAEQRQRDGEIRRSILLERARQRRLVAASSSSSAAALDGPAASAAAVDADAGAAAPAVPARRFVGPLPPTAAAPPADPDGLVVGGSGSCASRDERRHHVPLEHKHGSRLKASVATAPSEAAVAAAAVAAAAVPASAAAASAAAAGDSSRFYGEHTAPERFSLFDEPPREDVLGGRCGPAGREKGKGKGKGKEEDEDEDSQKRSHDGHSKGKSKSNNPPADPDEKYRLGYGADEPWYAKKRACARERRERAEESRSGGVDERAGESRGRKKHVSRGVEVTGAQHPAHPPTTDARHPTPPVAAAAAASASWPSSGVSSLDRLRQERLERERKERERAARLLAQKTVANHLASAGGGGAAAGVAGARAVVHGRDGPARGKPPRYNSGFGYGR